MKTLGIFQAAQDNWPEDEAHQVLDAKVENIRDAIACGDTDDAEWIRSRIAPDMERMRKILLLESDGPALVTRFNAECLKILAAAGITIP